ncbi:MAG: putative glycoside hydrolase [Elusimicrobia bacterium]|nr:putative glycoside hydrolase [Elusimicrobiota bacterium]
MKLFSLNLKATLLSAGVIAGIALFAYNLKSSQAISEPPAEKKEAESATTALRRSDFVKGIHLTSWVAGSKKARKRIQSLLDETELNSVVIAIKEYQGEVYIPGAPLAEKYGSYVNAIPDVKTYLEQIKSEGVYTIARIVVFKDDLLARKRPNLAVKRPDGSIWSDRHGNAWTDPYNPEVWEYNFSVATQAVALGFQEIQFDYIRFPSDGNIRQCRYSYQNHNSTSAAKALASFLEESTKRLRPLGAQVSIDIFGLTPSVQHDMGIGQKILQLAEQVDYVSPMVYPSHYAKGEYGIANPNLQPYKVVYRTMSDAKKRLGNKISSLRPYLQDFSLGRRYGAKEVRAQILACEEQGIGQWILWNPSCLYTRSALKSKDGILPSSAIVPEEMRQKLAEKKEKHVHEQ